MHKPKSTAVLCYHRSNTLFYDSAIAFMWKYAARLSCNKIHNMPIFF